MTTDFLYELGDIAILVALWLSLGGELAVIVYLCYMIVGMALEHIQTKQAKQEA